MCSVCDESIPEAGGWGFLPPPGITDSLRGRGCAFGAGREMRRADLA